MRPQALKLGPGSDLRRSLEQLAIEWNASGFVLGVVGNLSRAAFQCPGQAGPTVLEGDLEIITLQGTLSPQGVHLHLSLSDGACQVWGGHLEPGTMVLKGADLLVGFLTSADPSPAAPALADPAPAVAAPQERPATLEAEPRVEIAVASGCPWSARALRLLRTLGIAHQVWLVDGAAEREELERLSGHGGVPQVFIDGQWIGGYDALAELHGQGVLEALRG
jgi:predicted DNA-binding protein with PD1-like motif/glutaredoxin